ncbi:hypothetical protein HDU67_003058, partial [Dinochytrium kinnereticum]
LESTESSYSSTRVVTEPSVLQSVQGIATSVPVRYVREVPSKFNDLFVILQVWSMPVRPIPSDWVGSVCWACDEWIRSKEEALQSLVAAHHASPTVFGVLNAKGLEAFQADVDPWGRTSVYCYGR